MSRWHGQLDFLPLHLPNAQHQWLANPPAVLSACAGKRTTPAGNPAGAGAGAACTCAGAACACAGATLRILSVAMVEDIVALWVVVAAGVLYWVGLARHNWCCHQRLARIVLPTAIPR